METKNASKADRFNFGKVVRPVRVKLLMFTVEIGSIADKFSQNIKC